MKAVQTRFPGPILELCPPINEGEITFFFPDRDCDGLLAQQELLEQPQRVL